MFSRLQVLKLTLACLVGVTVSIGIGHAAETYRNEKYGFSLNVPTGVKLCKEEPPNPDHGPSLLLESSLSCKALAQTEARIAVIGEFNASEAQDLEELKNDICNQRGSPGTPPDDLMISGQKTLSCLVKTGNGKVEIWVFAQNSEGSNIDTWINYEVSLLTTESRVDKDLAILRRVLNGICLLNPA